MLSNNRLVLVLALLFAAPLHAQDAKCPSFQEKSALSTVVLFDGPPEQKADLMPDVSKGDGDHAYASWKVGYIFDAGRKLFLVCRYAGLQDADAVTVKVEKKVRRCIYRTHSGKQPAELTCK